MASPPTTSRAGDLSQWYPLVRIMGARLIVLIAVMASLVTLMQEPERSHLPFYLFMMVAFLMTIVYAVGVRSQRSAQASVNQQFAVDPLIVTGLIYFTGGISSQLYLLYPLVILAAGIAVSGRHALHVTILSVLVYSLLTVALFFGLLVSPGADPATVYDGSQVFQDLMFRILVVSMVGGATTYFTGVLTRQEEMITKIQKVAGSILDNVASPLLVVNPGGRIVNANPAAMQLIGMKLKDIEGRALDFLFTESAPDLNTKQPAGKIWTLRRGDGTTFPAFFAVSKGNFPFMGPLEATPEEEADFFLVALFDVSRFDRDGDGHLEDRSTAAVVSEIAHVVRNPLTAIRGAGELLSSAVDQMFSSSGQLSSEDWEMIKSMCQLIFEQSLELDDKVKHFLEEVASGSTNVEDALAEARKWVPAVLAEAAEETNGQNTGS